MTTYQDMQMRIGDEIQDASLTMQVQRAIQDAIAVFEPHRFYFNQATATFSTVANQEYYGATDFADIPLLIEIDSMLLNIMGSKAPMVAADFWYMDGAQNGGVIGPPQSYCYYGQRIRFYPIPDAVYPIVMSYHKRLTPLVAGTDTNAWMVDGEMLIRQTAKGILALDVLQETNVAQGAQLLANIALDRLQMETRKRRSNGRLKNDLPLTAGGDADILSGGFW